MGIKHQESDDVFASGTEASFNADEWSLTSENRDNDISHAISEEKRLQWVSAQDRTSGTSFASSTSLTSNSSVEQLLSQREMDPETLLRNLGFGNFTSDNPISRVPYRFLVNLHLYHHVDFSRLLHQHSDFQLPIPLASETSQYMENETRQTEPHTEINGTKNQSVVESKKCTELSQWTPQRECSFCRNKSLMRLRAFCAWEENMTVHTSAEQEQRHLLEEYKSKLFIEGKLIPDPFNVSSGWKDEETERIQSLPSILDLPNRRALAQQGFYGSEYAISKSAKDQRKQSKSTGKSNSSSAAERRKQFQDSVKSRSKNWSLTESHEDVGYDISEQSQSLDSFEHGFNLRSFSDRISSNSSIESVDSNLDEGRYWAHQSSISNLRKQYQEAIHLSMDTETPTFNDLNLSKCKAKDLSISNVRKEQVNRFMLSVDGDADYIAHSLLRSAVKENDILLKGQWSTQSTITDMSPHTQNYSAFCYDKALKDTESNANFPIRSGSEISPEILSKNMHQPVSIVVEGEDNILDSCYSDQSNFNNSLSRESSHVGGSSYELNCLTLCARSDSCNTVVPQDSYYESEATDGDSTPRPGDVSPGMMHKSPNFIDSNKIQRDALFETPVTKCQSEVEDSISDSQSNAIQERFSKGLRQLKPIQSLPQESFELEEISSGNNVQQNGKDNRDKIGPMEKSNSTYSDSSGFADVDTLGEITQQMLSDLSQKTNQQQNSISSTKLNKNESALISHDDSKISHLNSLPVQDSSSKDSKIQKDASTDKSKAADNDVHVHVCKKVVEDLDKENVIPTLTSISYVPNETLEKSLVYSLNVPLPLKAKNSLIDRNKSVRYISSVNIEIDSVSDTDSAKYSNSCCSIKQVGHVKHVMVTSEDVAKTGDKDFSNNELDVNVWSGPSSFNVQYVTDQTEMLGGGESSHIKLSRLYNKRLQRATRSATEVTEGNSAKEEILRTTNAKEKLLAAQTQTVDWLLNSEKQKSKTHSWKGQGTYPFKTGRPFWASTPDLKNNRISAKPNSGQQKLKDSYHSFDYLNDKNEKDFDCLSPTGFRADKDCASSCNVNKFNNNFGRESLTLDNMKWPEMNQQVTDNFSYDSMYERIDKNQPFIAGSSFSIPEDHLNYVRLARLVNGPSIALGAYPRLPSKKFIPSVHIKDWIMLSRQRNLEEETRLLQHVVQRYKTELCVMETLLCNMYETALTELTLEQRRDVEELQHLWGEVHKEVIKMDDLLASRLRAVTMGNECYSPFPAMQIVQTMINLLCEQLYHVQMCIGRDSSCNEDYEKEANQSVKSERSSSAEGSSVGSAWMSAISSQISELRTNLKESEESHKQELQKQISELKASILSDVKGELSSTVNTKLLQLQLKARDNEIHQLKMELLRNVISGGTCLRQRIESDV